MATLTLDPQALPLRIDEQGVMRVGTTRVSLDSIVYAFLEGATAEEIVQAFDTLDLADVYAVISYYLRHRSDVEAYVQRQVEQAENTRNEWKKNWPEHSNYRQLLLSRLAAKEQSGVASAQ